ncbi:MAG: D-alanyl-D-alanine carboxypeptidase family protein [Brevundimonas sp.]
MQVLGRVVRGSRAARIVSIPIALGLVWTLSATSPAFAAPDDPSPSPSSTAPADREDTLDVGETLTATQSLVSADGGRVVVVERSGVLSMYDGQGELRWTSGPGVPGSRLVVRHNGDVALMTADGKVRWHTKTAGTKGAHLVVQDDGDIVVRDAKDHVVWSAGTQTPASLLNSGGALAPGEVLASQDGRHTLVMSEDGDLQLLGPDARVRWSSETSVAGSSLALRDDGDLAIRTPAGYAAWRTGTYGHKDATLTLQDDGNLVLVDREGNELWSTGTALGPESLAAGKSLKVGERLDSPDGRLTLRVDQDGLRLEVDGHAVWAVLTAAPDEKLRLTLRKNGDLVLKGTDDAVYWTSESAGTTHATLTLDVGGVVLRAPTGQELWRADVPAATFTSDALATDCKDVDGPVPFAATVLTSTGIRVHPCMLAAVEALIAAARADGIDLGGWGWRSNAEQRALRAQNCNAAGRCHPATAPPGKSLHERGTAIDFTVDGRTIHGGPAYAWMVEHAGDYGLHNLRGEPWHWDVGH